VCERRTWRCAATHVYLLELVVCRYTLLLLHAAMQPHHGLRRDTAQRQRFHEEVHASAGHEEHDYFIVGVRFQELHEL